MSIPVVHIDRLAPRPTTRRFMQPGEQEALLALINIVQPRIMVEIGVQEGLTARAVLRNIRTIDRYYGIDVDVDYQFEIPAQRFERPKEPGVLVKDDPRFELIIRDRAELPMVADVVFIDGDHGYEAVRRDDIWATGVVRNGGLIVWHDYGNSTVQVTEVLDELHAEGRQLYRIAGTWLVYERR